MEPRKELTELKEAMAKVEAFFEGVSDTALTMALVMDPRLVMNDWPETKVRNFSETLIDYVDKIVKLSEEEVLSLGVPSMAMMVTMQMAKDAVTSKGGESSRFTEEEKKLIDDSSLTVSQLIEVMESHDCDKCPLTSTCTSPFLKSKVN